MLNELEMSKEDCLILIKKLNEEVAELKKQLENEKAHVQYLLQSDKY